MPRDLGVVCKKRRQHPDGLHLSSSLPKRLLSTSQAEIGSSVEDASISPGFAMNTPHGFLCNSASSGLINSDFSTSIHPTHSSMSLGAASSKLEGPSFVLSRLPSDVASSKVDGPSFVLSRLPSDAASSKLEGVDRMHLYAPYRSSSSRHKGLDYDGELSDITFEKHARSLPSGQEADRAFGSEKATHVISRRDISSLNSKDELWHKAAHGCGDTSSSRGNQWESSSKLVGASRQKRDHMFSSMACESASSCATSVSIRPMQPFSQMYWPAGKSSTTFSDTFSRAEVLVAPRLQERTGCKDGTVFQTCSSSEDVLHPSLTHKATSEELSPSYVLSSGRMSLEEEARLGRRPPTIDRDFEEYFSSLML